MNQDDKDAETAETLEQGFNSLLNLVYKGKLDSRQETEVRKIFFCGAAFVADRLIRWAGQPEFEDKIGNIIKELVKFSNYHKKKHEQSSDIATAIEEAWKYASPDKD